MSFLLLLLAAGCCLTVVVIHHSPDPSDLTMLACKREGKNRTGRIRWAIKLISAATRVRERGAWCVCMIGCTVQCGGNVRTKNGGMIIVNEVEKGKSPKA